MSEHFNPQPATEARVYEQNPLVNLGKKETTTELINFLRGQNYGLSDADINDITQQALEKALKGINDGTFNKSKPLLPWLITIAKHTALDMLRGQKVSTKYFASPVDRNERDTILDTKDSAPTPREQYLNAENLLILQNNINDLEPDHQVIIHLLQDGLNLREIAERLKTPYTTIKSRFNRIKKNIKE